MPGRARRSGKLTGSVAGARSDRRDPGSPRASSSPRARAVVDGRPQAPFGVAVDPARRDRDRRRHARPVGTVGLSGGARASPRAARQLTRTNLSPGVDAQLRRRAADQDGRRRAGRRRARSVAGARRHAEPRAGHGDRARDRTRDLPRALDPAARRWRAERAAAGVAPDRSIVRHHRSTAASPCRRSSTRCRTPHRSSSSRRCRWSSCPPS